MLDIGIGISSGKNAATAAEEISRLAKANKPAKNKIDLALLFTSPEFSSANFLKTINNMLGGVPIVGLTGPAVICNQGIFKHGAVLLLLSLPEGALLSHGCVKGIKTKPPREAGEEIGDKLLCGLKNNTRGLGLLFFDRLVEDGPNIISGLQDHLGRSFPCWGVFPSDHFHPIRTSLYFNQSIVTDGCAGIVLGGRISCGAGMKHGWKPLGKPHSVSAAEANIIKKIDGQPAVKLYEEYLACDLNRLKKEIKTLSISYPIGVFAPGETEYILRNVHNVTDDGSLICQGNIPEGSMIRLMISTKETCLKAAYAAVAEAVNNVSNPMLKFSKTKTSQLAIAFSSFSRYNLLRRDTNRELEIIRESLAPNTPIIGLYSGCQLAPLTALGYRGQSYLHNQTISVLILEG
ncbi:MAG: FIST N-terminal domain-containing protein [Candidatus Omnitrophica bacterium]|jgi:hypothetical protein|nr:FIST C-terminal domain-containing protein [Candidatus Omnitrophota bacterium]MDD5080062.1 FIST N-terminal domain-containing protein [Candidatus Omnitrophota bacterium]